MAEDIGNAFPFQRIYPNGAYFSSRVLTGEELAETERWLSRIFKRPWWQFWKPRWR